MKYVIIGGGISGVTVAEKIRLKDRSSSINILSNEPILPYSRITISSVASGNIPGNKLVIRNIDKMNNEGISIRINSEAKHIDIDRKVVIFKSNNNSSDEEVPYDKLIISTGGAYARHLGVAGEDEGIKNIEYLYNVNDAEKINNDSTNKKSAGIIGGAFISVDFINIFTSKNIPTTLFLRGNGFLSRYLNINAQKIIEEFIKEKDVKILKNININKFNKDEDNNLKSIETDNGIYDIDIVGIGVGIERITDLIKTSGIKYMNGISVNKRFETNIPDVYACGDIAEIEGNTFGDWLSARLMGETLGAILTGENIHFEEEHVNTLNMFGHNVCIFGNPTCDNVNEEVFDSNMYVSINKDYDNRIVGGICIDSKIHMNQIKKAVKNKVSLSLEQVLNS